jgi:hypothetical protein
VSAIDPDTRNALMRLNARAWGIAFGLVLAAGLFIATNILVLRGGAVVGPHLGLIGVYLPGYSVTFVGSLIGFVYMFVIGYGLGRVVAAVYNAIAKT